jgi:hypothetical protein
MSIQTKFYLLSQSRDQSRIDIYEWKINERVYTYRQLARLELDEKI